MPKTARASTPQKFQSRACRGRGGRQRRSLRRSFAPNEQLLAYSPSSGKVRTSSWQGMSRELISLRVNRGYAVNPPNMDLLLTLVGFGDVVGGLHPHQRVHFHSKGFLNAERHLSREVSLTVKQAGQSLNESIFIYFRNSGNWEARHARRRLALPSLQSLAGQSHKRNS